MGALRMDLDNPKDRATLDKICTNVASPDSRVSMMALFDYVGAQDIALPTLKTPGLVNVSLYCLERGLLVAVRDKLRNLKESDMFQDHTAWPLQRLLLARLHLVLHGPGPEDSESCSGAVSGRGEGSGGKGLLKEWPEEPEEVFGGANGSLQGAELLDIFRCSRDSWLQGSDSGRGDNHSPSDEALGNEASERDRNGKGRALHLDFA